MWSKRTAAILASACLLAAVPAKALWPHPSSYAAGKDDSFVRVADDLSFKLADGTDQSRVPSDLRDAIDAAAKLANSISLWPLTTDRGESYRNGVNNAKLISSVQIKVLELMPETQPNPCIGKTSSVNALEQVLQARAVQQPFQGRKVHTDPTQSASNACSIASRAIRELSYATSKTPLNLETDKSAPVDLGYLDAEMYHLSVPADGSSIRLTSYTAIGALRGLQTLLQLVYALPPSKDDPKTIKRFVKNVPIKITDRAAYPYRGLLLDTARNWYDIATIKKLIDTMSFVKMNQLHWHATDTQSWPLAFSNGGNSGVQLSLLAQTGSYGWYRESDGSVRKMVYTEEDIEGIIDYAAAKGVNVIIETDMPAHMLSGVESLDKGKLMACPNAPNWQTVAAEPPSGQLRLVPNPPPTDAKNFKVPQPISDFVTALLKKVASLSKSPYVSSGGDEPNWNCWNLPKEESLDPYLAPFMSLVTKVTSDAGKKGMVWEEMAVKFQETAKALAPGSLVTIWNDANNSRIALENNKDINIVLAPVNYFYLDCGQASFLGNTIANSWCPFVSWQMTYSFFPEQTIANATTGLSGTSADAVKKKFVGGEHAIWSESIDKTNVESKVWPRAAAGAEVFWSGEKVDGQRRSAIEALPRLMDLRYRLVEMGVGAEPLQPLWCATRPGQCNLS